MLLILTLALLVAGGKKGATDPALEAAARYEHAHEGAESDEATEALEEAAA